MLNEALRLVRVFHDLNKTQTADRVGLSKSYITELERGDKKVTMEVLEKYADAFSRSSSEGTTMRPRCTLLRDCGGGSGALLESARAFGGRHGT